MAARKNLAPTKRSPELEAKLLAWVSEGGTIRQFARENDVSYAMIYDWVEAVPELATRLARARESGYDAIAAECLDIADNSLNDYVEKLADAGDTKADAARLNGEHVQRSKLRVETRLKLLKCWDPKRYGDKLLQENTGAMTLIVQTGVPRKGDE